MIFTLDHIGWVTNTIEKFEFFWCYGLGFEVVWEANISPEKVFTLFGIRASTIAKRYKKGDMTIEIHTFNPPLPANEIKFDAFGINHIGLLVDNREEFLKDLKSRLAYVEEIRYWDPSGWWNIFIKDYDGNLIELREIFK